jgi:hypothetical protein
MNAYLWIILIGLLFLTVFLALSQPKKKKNKYVPGTGKTLIHKQGFEYLDLDCNGGSSHSAMEIVERNRWIFDYSKIVFARTLRVIKTKDFVRNGDDEYTYIIECWE